MSRSGDVFEPESIRKLLKSFEGSVPLQRKFETLWKENVKKRVDSWLKHRDKQSKALLQLQWEANIVEYVDYLRQKTTLHGNSKGGPPPSLRAEVPLLGPHFSPPSYTHVIRRDPSPKIVPETAYLMPLTVLHPLYFPDLLRDCPQCGSKETHWDQWNGTGAREVHGVSREERAIGYQLRCLACKTKYAKGMPEHSSDPKAPGYCFATTSQIFWRNWEHWRIPRNVPIFTSRTALTHELFNLIVELRPSSTSGGIAENIKQLHLLEYKQQMLEYLQYFDLQLTDTPPVTGRTALQHFSAPNDEAAYNDVPITSDMITDVYVDFVEKTRKQESTDYCKTRTGVCLSLDNTFKSAGKAVIVDKDKTRSKPWKGGVLSVINEISEILAWRFCQSASPSETREIMGGITKRHDALQIPRPIAVVVDNCCQVRRYVQEGVPPAEEELGAQLIDVILDVWHFMMRYALGIVNGTKNPFRSPVLLDIRNSIIKTPAKKGSAPATYWEKDEQEKRLVEAFEKWTEHGGVWSVAAAKIHADQLAHVRKGCLVRRRQDVSMDGSRIEGSHKAWNSIQRAQPSGLEVYSSLAHDFVLRRNIRIASARIEDKKRPAFVDKFVSSAYSSHHVGLVNHVAHLFNTVLKKEPQRSQQNLHLYAVLPQVSSEETFGLVQSQNATSFGGLMVIKDEMDDDERYLQELDEMSTDVNHSLFLQQLNIDESQLTVLAEKIVLSTTVQGKRKIIDSVDISGSFEVHQSSQAGSQFIQSPVPPAKRMRHDEIQPSAMDLTADNWNVQSIATGQGMDRETPSDRPDSSKAPCVAPSLQTNLKLLTEPLPLPPQSAQRLTRSQLLFSVSTMIDPRALVIKHGVEFFLFMTMRQEFKWATFSMSTKKWVPATKIYNSRLEAEGQKKGEAVFKKNPRALMEKLCEVEITVAKRIATGNFVSKSGTETFWRLHCFAVQAVVKSEASATDEVSVASAAKKGTRKPAVCPRCQTLMYPKATGSPENHKRGVCADGVSPKVKAGDTSLPDWPQPQGIFSDGQTFNPIRFLNALRDLYNKVIEGGASSECDYSMEDQAFTSMLRSRCETVNNGTLFRLFNLGNVEGTPQSLLVEVNGINYLRLDCLCPSDNS